MRLDRQRRDLEVILDSVDIGVAVLDLDGCDLVGIRRDQQYIEPAHPDGTEGMAGQLGDTSPRTVGGPRPTSCPRPAQRQAKSSTT